MTKTFGGQPVLRDVDIVLPSLSFTTLVGPNGAGKTTFLRLFATTMRPSSGTIHWGRPDGTPYRDPERVRQRLGFAGHAPLIYDDLSARENLQFSLRLRVHDRPEQEADRWLERFMMSSRADERTDSLSRGMRQRVALAQALAGRPEFLLLDEPTNALDGATVGILLEALREARGHATIVVAAHDPQVYQDLADARVRIAEGSAALEAGPR